MGTNFYAQVPYEPTAHVGKRSAGWPFLFHVERGRFATFDELVGWLETTPDVRVIDEYGRPHDTVEFVRMARTWGADKAAARAMELADSGCIFDERGHPWADHEFC